MSACCSGFRVATEHQFNAKKAAQELSRFREKGVGPTARLLLHGLDESASARGTLLDVGSGVGSLTFTLLERGISNSVAVDASAAFIHAAREEAERRGVRSAVRFIHDDFVALAPQLSPADIVTLDRVVCCYPMWRPLLAAALDRASRCVALSYPRDAWHVRAAVGLENGARWLTRNPFRTFVHPARAMVAFIEEGGFHLVSRKHNWSWYADVFVRRGVVV